MESHGTYLQRCIARVFGYFIGNSGQPLKMVVFIEEKKTMKIKGFRFVLPNKNMV